MSIINECMEQHLFDLDDEITLQAMDSEQPYKLSGAVVTSLGI
jgi:hypothetical protein